MKDRLKILYVLPRFFPFKGGAENHFFELGKRLVEKGYEVSVLTSDFAFRDNTLKAEEQVEGIKIKRLKSYFFRPMYLWFAPSLLKEIWNADFDVIHVSGFGFIWVEFVLLLRKLKGNFTAVNTPHGPFMAFQDEESADLRGFSKKIYDSILGFILPRIYRTVFAVVDHQKKWIKETYKFKEENIAVVQNGIPESYLEEKPYDFKKEDKIVITYTGRMEWYKGIQHVIEAIDLMVTSKKKLPDFEFHVMGRPDKFTQNLETTIEEKELEDYVKLIFAPSDEERDVEYYNSQIFILPSKWEATGIVLLEAMAKGNVLISTKQNEAHTLIIEEGVSGFSYDFGDIEGLESLLVLLLKDFELRKKIIDHNIEFARNFTWEAIFPKYLKTLKSILKEK